MSFLFDDDNDDNAFSQNFSQNFQFSSKTQSQKQVNFSQFSSTSPEKQSFSQLFMSPSQKPSLLTPKSEASTSRSKSTFICQNCGTVDNYYHDSGGMVTCNNCFTQSQSHGLEELDYDETQHMAARNRDGTLKRIGGKNRTHKTNADGTAMRGRPAVPLDDLDRSKRPPSLQACLRGFQSVLHKSCKILCLDLLPTITTEVQSNATANASEHSDSEESNAFASGNYNNSYDNPKNQNGSNTGDRKRKVYHQVSKTVRKLWKAYLLSWSEGADYYSNLYPQMRFAFRDQFLCPTLKTLLYQTIAARVEERLTEQIRKEEQQADDESDSDSDSSNESNSDSDSDDESHTQQPKKKVKLEEKSQGGLRTTELDSLYDLFDQRSEKKIKEENVVSEDEIPIPDVVLSRDPKTGVRRKSNAYNYTYSNRGRDSNRSSKNNNDENREESDSKHENEEDDDNLTVASDLSIVDAAEYKRNAILSRKRKRTKHKEVKKARSANPYAKMIFHHNKMMVRKTKSKGRPRLGRKEAALLVKPSMELVLVILLVATSSHGVTEGKLAEWAGNGSLPILDAFRCLLTTSQQEELSMLGNFFSLAQAPDPAVLKFYTRRIHVACGYRPPKVKLFSQHHRTLKRTTRGRTLTSSSLGAAGRLVRPSSVPILLGFMVSELGFSQKVLNYSLALMGLPVSIHALQAEDVPKSHGKGGSTGSTTEIRNQIPEVLSQKIDLREDWDSDTTPVFDLSDPADVRRRHRYRAKMRQRKRRARIRAELGITVSTIYRSKIYRIKKPDQIPEFVSSKQSNIHLDFVPFQNEPSDEKSLVAVNKKNAEWLPPALRSARPDKLIDIDQILAVVAVACKMIPEWEKNHHYIFSHGHNTKKSRDNQADNESRIGDFGDVKEASPDETNSGLLDVTPRDRFVPWNFESFCRIGNGKTESDYLEFLRECIFRGDRYALPRFVESLNKTSSTSSDDAIFEDGGIKGEGMNDVDSDYSMNATTQYSTSVVSNNVILGWKKKKQLKSRSLSTSRGGRAPYRPTKTSDVQGLKKPGGALGPLIEYMAYKTGTCPNRIFRQLLELDEELVSRAKPAKVALSLPPDACYRQFVQSSNGKPTLCSTEQENTSSLPKEPRKERQRRKQRQKSTPPATVDDTNSDFALTNIPYSIGGNDTNLTQISTTEIDEIITGPVYEV